MDVAYYLDIARHAARSAGEFALAKQPLACSEMKQGNQIVTDADKQSQKIILDILLENFPDHGIIAEEGPDGNLLKILPAKNINAWWVIDPIDGTRNYAQGIPIYCVSIGLLIDGFPHLGVIYDPNTKSMFSGGIHLQPMCNAIPMACRNSDLNSNSQIAVSSQYDSVPPKYLEYFLKNFCCLSLGSAALHYAYTAKGAFLAAFSHNVKLWDIVAGAAIAQEAGAACLNLDLNPLFPIDADSYQGQKLPMLLASKVVIPEFDRILRNLSSDNK